MMKTSNERIMVCGATLREQIEWWAKLAGGTKFEDFSKVLDKLGIVDTVLIKDDCKLPGFCNISFLVLSEDDVVMFHIYAPAMLEVKRRYTTKVYKCDFSTKEILKMYGAEYEKGKNIKMQTVVTNGEYFAKIIDSSKKISFECIVSPKTIDSKHDIKKLRACIERRLELLMTKDDLNCEMISEEIESSTKGEYNILVVRI